jgi:uncharacterized protein (DUF342 family)
MLGGDLFPGHGCLVTKPESTTNKIILVPEILFQTERITDPDKVSFETAELVRKEQVLVRLLEPEKTDIRHPCTLIRGEHTALSPDNNSLLAKTDGFPIVTKTSQMGIDHIMVTIVPLCMISSDKMSADISLFPPPSSCPDLTTQLIIEVLAENEIRFGYSPEHIQKLLDKSKEKQTKITRVPIANGLLPLDGQDSFIRFAIEVGPLPGKLLGNGKIDFRERKMFVGVTEGQTIATRIPATTGTPGINVSGEEIVQSPGRDIPLTVSDDTHYDESSGIITARHDGILSLVSENSIKVCAKQVISGNIDYNTGNIESYDAVEISGTVLPGFTVQTQGDLLIGGNVRSGKINCHGNLVIKGGILGKECRVRSYGDTDFSFMERGHLRVNGSVIIRKQAYHANIMADGDIYCEEKSRIMGGQLLCSGNMNVGTVGSPNAPAALLAAGISPGIFLRYLSMRSQLHDIVCEHKVFLQRFGKREKTAQRKSLEDSISKLENEIKELNLIPAFTISQGDGTREYLSNINISVHGTIFAGTELQIGNTIKVIQRDQNNVRFTHDKYSDLISVAPL